MLRILIRKELLEILLSFKFVVVFTICVLTMLTSIVLSAVDYKADLQQYNSSRSLNRANLENHTSWQALGLQGLQVAKSPAVLTIFSSGLQQASGKVFAFSTRELPHAVGNELTEAPILAAFGELDSTFIVGVIISLFALLFSYDSISGEKEQGTLKQVLSNSLPRDSILTGKLVGGFACVVIALSLPFFLGILAMVMVFSTQLRGDEWFRLALIFLVFVLYLLSQFMLGIFVSSRTKSSTVSFLICLFVWVFFVNIFPKASILLARHIVPLPSVHEITAQKVARATEYSQRATELALELSRAVNRGEFSIEEYGERSAAMRKELDDDFAQKSTSYQQYVRQKRRHMLRWAMNLSRLSPMSAMRYAVMSLAGTGLEREERFVKALEEYRYRFADFVQTNAGRENVAARVFSADVPEPLDLSGMPEFQFQEERLGTSLVRALPDILILLVYSSLFFTLAFFSFRYYDPR